MADSKLSDNDEVSDNECIFNDEDYVEASLNAETFEEWLDVYSKVYDNLYRAPFYGSYFRNNSDGTNDEETGELFKILTKRGIICVNSQKNIPGCQKAYIDAYVREKKAREIYQEINRFDGICCFWTHVNRKEADGSIPVTYTEEPEPGSTIMKGKIYTRMHFSSDWDTFETLREHMSEDVADEFSPQNFVYLACICTMTSFESNYLLKKLVEVTV